MTTKRPRAICYARVSTSEQAQHGFSLRQQIEALRDYCGREGYEVLEEIVDPGQSGVTLDRPGLDRVRDLVAAGGVSLVLAQARDRIAREPAYHYLLGREFEECGCRLRALNDRGDESPEGELTDGILDQLAKYEWAKIAERTRRGKLRRAREGNVIPAGKPPHGFRYNADRTNYVVDEADMTTIRGIFRMVGVEGHTLYGVKCTFVREGIPTPGGAKYWTVTHLRRVIVNDVYRPHTGEEVAELVLPEVAARLAPGEKYGVWRFNKERVALTHGGKKRRKFTKKPKSEWIAVPVTDPGIRREWVDAARQAVEGFVRPSRAAGRVWELSGGVAYCACGRRMTTHSLTGDGGYHYYVCQRRKRDGKGACEHGRFHRAEALEAAVATYVSDLLGDGDRVAAHVDAAIGREADATRNPEGSAKAWLNKLAECDRRRAAFQDQQAAGLMTLDELGDRLRTLDEEHAVAERELGRLRDTQRRIEELEANKDAVLRMFGTGLLVGIEWFPSNLRRAVYELLATRVTVCGDRTLTIEAISTPTRCATRRTSRSTSRGCAGSKSGSRRPACWARRSGSTW